MFHMPTAIDAALKHVGRTRTQIAEALGVSTEAVRLWQAGQTGVSGETAKKIEEVTQGKVKAKDLRPDLFG
jgi:DNA-binding transcriptional regulator YdaS (Cro superfamily)